MLRQRRPKAARERPEPKGDELLPRLHDLELEIDDLLNRAIEAQRKRVFEIARAIDSRIAPEDLWNPQDLPVVARDARWNYEDGILAGWLSAQMAIRAHLRQKRSEDSS